MAEFKKIFTCSCGKTHDAMIDEYIVENNAICRVANYVKKYNGTKAFVLADVNTFHVAGEKVCSVLKANEIPFSTYIYANKALKPNEHAIGSAVMHFDASCDIIVAVGSGVINDIGKLLAKTAGCPYIIVATAPSMDGYASATSSVDRDGLKQSLPSTCANVVIGDIDVLKQAPQSMLVSGLGDMLAKYVSICEWRLSHLITGEYYCEEIAAIVRKALKKCMDHAEGLLSREESAIKAVFEGLVLGGVAMNYAGLSRPASGVEHYFSHIWDMRGLAFGEKVDYHGIQCGVATLLAAKIYEQIKIIVPNKEKGLAYVQKFSYKTHCKVLKKFLGEGADTMIALEQKEKKYDVDKHKERITRIIDHWDAILAIIEEEIPPAKEIDRILTLLHGPKTVEDLGLDKDIAIKTFHATKDIRDKYVASWLCFDLGIIDEIAL
ncbi:MAG: sn-glycerol-1-phosphate dehydrogenase [Ruminococcaceae bacterium]|nr:sn-glycerol-1-phosphate dehydrogenase [Oscillospiraceae bacterium]